MPEALAAYAAQRAEALALVYLTRRDDLVVSREPDDYAFDLRVTVSKEKGRLSGRIFGVEVKASRAPLTSAEREAYASRMHLHPALSELPFPVCLFHFTMEDDEGYYTWILRPDVTQEGRPRLKHGAEPGLARLDDDAIGAIVDEVNRWYDRRARLA
jgi:hypothetical protein